MQLPSFFKAKGPRQFNYKPMYYDEAKERLDRQVRLAKKEAELGERGELTEKGALQTTWRNNKRTRERKRSNSRIVLIAGLLVLIFYLLLR